MAQSKQWVFPLTMVGFHIYVAVYQRINFIKIPMVFLWNHHFPMVFLWFSSSVALRFTKNPSRPSHPRWPPPLETAGWWSSISTLGPCHRVWCRTLRRGVRDSLGKPWENHEENHRKTKGKTISGWKKWWIDESWGKIYSLRDGIYPWKTIGTWWFKGF